MYFIFLWEVVKRAFTPATRVTDILQILAASTLPAASKFAGVSLPANAGDDALAYIGLIAVSFIAIRLLWAPYSLWKEQGVVVDNLNLELSKPERIELENLSRLRATYRIELAEVVREIYLYSCTRHTPRYMEGQDIFVLLRRGSGLVSKSGGGETLNDAFTRLVVYSGHIIQGQDSLRDEYSGRAAALSHAIVDFLHGRITAEALERQLPPDIEQETQP